jgi:hypothetical protein
MANDKNDQSGNVGYRSRKSNRDRVKGTNILKLDTYRSCFSERKSFRISLNDVLLGGYAVVFEEFCDKSEFSKVRWALKYGCQ